MEFSQPYRRVSTFLAGFDSECATCGDDILEGDTAGYVPGDERPSCQVCIREYLEDQ